MSNSRETMAAAMDLHRRGRLDEASDLYRRVLAQEPAHFGATHLSGVVLLQRGQAAEAERLLARALELNPGIAEVYLHRGNALGELDRREDALLSYEAALRLQPRNPQLHLARGNALVELERYDEAVIAFDCAIEADPEYDPAFVNRGVLRLLRGNYRDGLADYEHRRPRDPARRMLPRLSAPEWTGQDLAGRSILVSDATGLGDVIQFCRYLPLLADRGAHVSFLGNARLVGLLRSLDPRVELLAALDGDHRFDFQCKLLSLPYLFGTELASIPARVPYLHPRVERVEEWAARIGPQGFRVGVCWRGNPSRTIDAGRAIPLAGLQPLAAIDGVRLISLQKKFGLEELSSLPEGMQVETLGEDFDEGPDAFLDSAAVIANLDLVICSCTSIAHLAGALGAPTWVALKRVPEWRWSIDRADNPWYPSQRLYRQARAGQWASVMAEMTSDLHRRLSG